MFGLVILFLAFVCLIAGISTLWKGRIKLSAKREATGGTARIIAACLIAAASGMAWFSLVTLPRLFQ